MQPRKESYCSLVPGDRPGLYVCQVCGHRFFISSPPERVRRVCDGSLATGRPRQWFRGRYERPPLVPTVRHLLFHIWPVTGCDWRWHVEWLKRYWHIWNGRKLIGVVLDANTECECDVVKEFPGDAEFVFCANNPKLREGQTFIKLINKFGLAGPEEAVFFAHTKGMRYPRDHIVWLWSHVMYWHLLRRWEECMEAFRDPNIVFVCSMLDNTHGFHPEYLWNWHITGSYYWFNLRFVQEHPQRGLCPKEFWYVEGWPSLFGPESIVKPMLLNQFTRPYSREWWLSDALPRHVALGGDVPLDLLSVEVGPLHPMAGVVVEEEEEKCGCRG